MEKRESPQNRLGGVAGARGTPQPDVSIPDPPEYLNEIALGEWNRVAPELLQLSLIANIDLATLAAYCECYSSWVEACQQCDEWGSFIELGKNGYKQVAPWVTVKLKMAAQMKSFAAEFGMSPGSRTKLKVKRPGRADGRGKEGGSKLDKLRNKKNMRLA